ncbi:Beta-lactamase [Aspergillus sclerotialis]|uniref:Beta-lactamase n=1 Tax=Aspergillus sclerotialis TaxID=2070753 RepID=A0A3A2ZVY1_9EURO|nr:Beta-lactamase [Aspergillus sclerotialis]
MKGSVFFSTLVSSSLANSVVANDVLKPGSPESVGLLPEPLKDMQTNLSRYTLPANYGSFTYNKVHPIQPGGSVIVGHESTVVSSFAFGNTNLYTDANGTLLPKDEWTPTKIDTIYDMASLTKVFTAVAALRVMDDGILELEKTVASYMPEFAVNGKENVTVRMLLTHTSGFFADPEPGLYCPKYKTMEQRVENIIHYPLEDAPGAKYRYSDLNFMNLRYLLERVTGHPIEELIHSFTSQLGMTSTFYNAGNKPPAQVSQYDRMAPTEYQIEVLGKDEPRRPQPVRGTVHDENAWALDGVSGHAGLFSAAPDVAKLCQMILNNGTYGGKQILSRKSVDMMFTNFNEKFPGNEHSIGFELNQYYFSGAMASVLTGGHTGFTGTTLVVDRPSQTFFVMLAHHVHPNREWSSNNIVREALGYWVARSLGRNVSFPPLD